MQTLRRISYAALGVAYTHLVFGAIVRISGSGMGCGDNWPKCFGHWFPPLDQPTLVVEWTHRLLASLLILSIGVLAVAAFAKRREPGVAGAGGVLPAAAAAVAIVLVTAGFGAVTVFLGNPTWATVVHWTLAMTLVATLLVAAIRAGAFGGESVRTLPAARRTMRSARGAAGLAFVAVVMGGLTAKWPSGSIACQGFPRCGANPLVPASAVHVQLGHRTIAVLLVLHLFGVMMLLRRRADAPAVKRAATLAFALALSQIAIAAAMVLLHLPPALRSLHEAVGVAIWLSSFAFAYLAALAARNAPEDEGEGARLPRSGRVTVRPAAQAESRALASPPACCVPAGSVEPAELPPADAPEASSARTRWVSGAVELVEGTEIDDAAASRIADAVAAAAAMLETESLVDAEAEIDIVREAIDGISASLPDFPEMTTTAETRIITEAIEEADQAVTRVSVDHADPIIADHADLSPEVGSPPAEEQSAQSAMAEAALPEEQSAMEQSATREEAIEAVADLATSIESAIHVAGAALEEAGVEAPGAPEEAAIKPPAHTMAVIVARGADL